jgi:cellulose synthase/poly-beta-1,6-N-acetylglucosamine synthase-like glycosyltransferase
VEGRPAIATSADLAVREFLSGHAHESALVTTTAWQRLKFAFWTVQLLVLLLYDYKIFFTIITAVLCIFYLFTITYKLITVFLSIVSPGDIRVSPEEIEQLDEDTLPVYTVLVPLYKEAGIAQKIVNSVTALDYPAEKLDVILLLEEDDLQTRGALEETTLPACVRTLLVPEGKPKTKPRACMHGLGVARGQYLVIYDAEDRPEPDQLKKAVIGFRRLPERVACLQAKLNYYNPRQNWLTKWFTIEYTTWFDLFLPGLNRMRMPIPLGGTSNHFKTEPLREIGGWDPFNVTEDCDLGIRLHEAGHRTRVMDSTTWEEANSDLGNWIRQRSRWVKGYVQTHLVHTRESLKGMRIVVALALGAWVAWGLVRVGSYLFEFIATRQEIEKRLASKAAIEELIVAAAAGVVLLLWGFLKRARRLQTFDRVGFLAAVGGLCFALPSVRSHLTFGSRHLVWLLHPAFRSVGLVVAAAGAALFLWGYVRRAPRLGVFGQASFLLTVGGLSLTLLLNPVFWFVGIAWLYFRWQIWYDTDWNDDAHTMLNYWSVASQWFWRITVVLLSANVMLIAVHLLACARRKLKDLVWYAVFVPVYWIVISIGAWRGFLQLFTRAHYWDKTVHGLAGEPPDPAQVGDPTGEGAGGVV